MFSRFIRIVARIETLITLTFGVVLTIGAIGVGIQRYSTIRERGRNPWTDIEFVGVLPLAGFVLLLGLGGLMWVCFAIREAARSPEHSPKDLIGDRGRDTDDDD